MKTKLLLVVLFVLTLSNVKAQSPGNAKTDAELPKVVFANDFFSATLEKILKSSGIEVLDTQPTFLRIYLGKELKISTYIDIDGDKQYLIFNGSNALKEGTTPAQAKELVSDINSQTNFIKAGYDQEHNKIEFRYYFWIKDGFTENSIISALEMYRITYMYTFSVDKSDLLK
ncbi:MAG: hypothetical protein NTZ69_03445 [Bacteroidia bacterium]|nr:hypothetical protein [Bacteroidia bacterium]